MYRIQSKQQGQGLSEYLVIVGLIVAGLYLYSLELVPKWDIIIESFRKRSNSLICSTVRELSEGSPGLGCDGVLRIMAVVA